ncbi:MAG: hypothetical protein H5U02_14230 [Clostridia bacterium]|nr:hypothetical protein [Clostridia bacterium]
MRPQTFDAITRRVNLRFHLARLSAWEARVYLQHHLPVAGVKRAFLRRGRRRDLLLLQGHTPRDHICTACLLDEFLQEKPLIGEATARCVLGEFEDDS